MLSTQTLSAGLTGFAAGSGVQLDAVPFIRTELLEAGELPLGPVIAVFTSQHAVEALPAIGPEWKVFCIGGTTRRLVEKRFGPEVIAGTAPSAEELARLIIDAERDVAGREADDREAGPGAAEREASGRQAGERVVFFCGNLRREVLPELLRQEGLDIEERIVYRTVLTPQRLEQQYAGVAFFSPSGVDSFFSVNPVNPDTLYFAIGRTTAAAVKAKTGRDAILASKPDKELLVKEMITHFKV